MKAKWFSGTRYPSAQFYHPSIDSLIENCSKQIVVRKSMYFTMIFVLRSTLLWRIKESCRIPPFEKKYLLSCAPIKPVKAPADPPDYRTVRQWQELCRLPSPLRLRLSINKYFTINRKFGQRNWTFSGAGHPSLVRLRSPTILWSRVA